MARREQDGGRRPRTTRADPAGHRAHEPQPQRGGHREAAREDPQPAHSTATPHRLLRSPASRPRQGHARRRGLGPSRRLLHHPRQQFVHRGERLLFASGDDLGGGRGPQAGQRLELGGRAVFTSTSPPDPTGCALRLGRPDRPYRRPRRHHRGREPAPGRHRRAAPRGSGRDWRDRRRPRAVATGGIDQVADPGACREAVDARALRPPRRPPPRGPRTPSRWGSRRRPTRSARSLPPATTRDPSPEPIARMNAATASTTAPAAAATAGNGMAPCDGGGFSAAGASASRLRHGAAFGSTLPPPPAGGMAADAAQFDVPPRWGHFRRGRTSRRTQRVPLAASYSRPRIRSPDRAPATPS